MMKVLYARVDSGIYTIQIHLDTTKTVTDPNTGLQVPDPAWIREYDWSTTPPAGVTPSAYQTNVQQETIRLAQHAYAVMTAAATVTAFEGTTF